MTIFLRQFFHLQMRHVKWDETTCLVSRWVFRKLKVTFVFEYIFLQICHSSRDGENITENLNNISNKVTL